MIDVSAEIQMSENPGKLNMTIENAPEEIHNVSQGYFSIARHYGGCKAFGTNYIYIPTEDKLIRMDMVKKYKKNDFAKMDRKKEFQPDLFIGEKP